MKSKIAGVALAAVVGACAVGMKANAAPMAYALPITIFTIEGNGGNQFDRATIYYVENRLDLSHLELQYFDNGNLVYNYTSYGISDFYHYFRPGVPDSTSDIENITASASGGGVNYYEYPISNSTSVFFGPVGGGTFISPVLTVMNDTVSYVPLPSSAPLFGAALLALGGATYARRRAKAVAA